MTKVERFTQLLQEIDAVLESYDPGELEPDRTIGAVVAERAAQRPILEKAIQLATDGLEEYPYNPQLLRRRAQAKVRIVTVEGEYPEIESAVEDLETALAVDPYNLHSGLQLLGEMFTFSAMTDADVATVAAGFAENSEALLLQCRALQIRALAYAGDFAEAENVYRRWAGLFPDSEYLQFAREDIDSLPKD